MGIIRLPVVKTRTGKSRSGIYRAIAEGTFPAPVKIGDRAVGWLENEVDQWIERLPRARTTAQQQPASRMTGHEFCC